MMFHFSLHHITLFWLDICPTFHVLLFRLVFYLRKSVVTELHFLIHVELPKYLCLTARINMHEHCIQVLVDLCNCCFWYHDYTKFWSCFIGTGIIIIWWIYYINGITLKTMGCSQGSESCSESCFGSWFWPFSDLKVWFTPYERKALSNQALKPKKGCCGLWFA